MFLAWREIRESPTRFTLIIAVITLMSYLTFFLASLANGLAYSYRASIDDWDAKSVALTATANKNLLASQLTGDQVDALEGEALRAQAVVIDDEDADKRTNAYIFGVAPNSFLMPPVESGEAPSENGVVVDSSLTTELGWELGTEFQLTGDDRTWEVVGFSKDQSFQAAPVIFADPSVFKDQPVNAVVSQSELTTDDSDVDILSVDKFILALPGYQAQVLTFSLMIGALIVIASFVLGIFIYVLTLQKRSMLGILKARGVPTRYLIWSGGAQATILSVLGVAAGAALTFVSAFFLPSQVPFRANLTIDAAITAGFILFSVLGGLFSVRVVAKIDPVEAIS